MSLISSLPLRVNGEEVDASWWNTIRSALLQLFPGSDGNPTAPYDVANNQSTYTNIGINYDPAAGSSWITFYEIYRKTDSSELLEVGEIHVTYKPVTGNFDYGRVIKVGDNSLNTSGSILTDPFQVTSGGDLQYKSDNLSGGNYVGKFSYSTTQRFIGGLPV